MKNQTGHVITHVDTVAVAVANAARQLGADPTTAILIGHNAVRTVGHDDAQALMGYIVERVGS